MRARLGVAMCPRCVHLVVFQWSLLDAGFLLGVVPFAWDSLEEWRKKGHSDKRYRPCEGRDRDKLGVLSIKVTENRGAKKSPRQTSAAMEPAEQGWVSRVFIIHTQQAVKVLASWRSRQRGLFQTGFAFRENGQVIRKSTGPLWHKHRKRLANNRTSLAVVDDPPPGNDRKPGQSQAEGAKIRALGHFGTYAPLRLHGFVLQRLKYDLPTPLLRRKALDLVSVTAEKYGHQMLPRHLTGVRWNCLQSSTNVDTLGRPFKDLAHGGAGAIAECGRNGHEHACSEAARPPEPVAPRLYEDCPGEEQEASDLVSFAQSADVFAVDQSDPSQAMVMEVASIFVAGHGRRKVCEGFFQPEDGLFAARLVKGSLEPDLERR